MAWHFMKQQQIPLDNSCWNGLMIHGPLSKPNHMITVSLPKPQINPMCQLSFALPLKCECMLTNCEKWTPKRRLMN